MTEIIQLTGNKSEFANYITDPIILKENSKVCLNKASFSIPVMVNRDNFFPKAEAGIANYDGTFFYVLLNGIDKPVSYQNFYDAYDNLDLLGNPTIAEFYSGVFNNYVDNLAILEDDAGNNYDIITFTDIIANACDTLFDFYEFHTQNKMEVTNLGDYEQAIDITINGTNIKKIKDNRSITKFGIVAQYEPRKVTELSPSIITWTAGQVNNFTPTTDSISAIDGDPAMAVSPNTFDPNGGYIAMTPTMAAGKSAVGILFMGKGHDDPLNITGVYQPENIDVGIEFSLDTAQPILQIIDGHQHFQYSHAGGIVEINTSHYAPANPIFTFDSASDKFWFLVRKGRPMNGTTQFTTTIIQGPGPTPQDVNNRIIYVAQTTLNTSQIQITTLAYSEGLGNAFNNWEYIPVSDDSKAEDDYLLNPATDREGIDGAQILQIQPAITNTDFSGERAFWDSIGISQVENNTNVIQGTNVGWNATVSWNLPKNIEKSYWIGTNKFGDIIAPEITFAVLPNYSSSLKVSDIPREIAVSILDLPIAPNVGSFIGATNQYDTGNINKVVNYIQTDASQLELESNGTLDYVYEAFNLVYRKLNNQQKMPITQMKIKLDYKNFADDRNQQIPNISGVAKLEILFD
jgi:hypothetical protein